MTTALEGGEGSASRLGRYLPPGKTRYPLYRRLGGNQGRSGQVRKISPPPGFDLRTVQPVASRYTDWAIRPTNLTDVPFHKYNFSCLKSRQHRLKCNNTNSCFNKPTTVPVLVGNVFHTSVSSTERSISARILRQYVITETPPPCTSFSVDGDNAGNCSSEQSIKTGKHTG
jgi:hypothetical protein